MKATKMCRVDQRHRSIVRFAREVTAGAKVYDTTGRNRQPQVYKRARQLFNNRLGFGLDFVGSYVNYMICTIASYNIVIADSVMFRRTTWFTATRRDCYIIWFLGALNRAQNNIFLQNLISSKCR